MKKFLLILFLLNGLAISVATAGTSVTVGSKIFTESYILSETAAQLIENGSTLTVDRKPGLGSTGILFESLQKGAVDVYPDYTGTLAETILKRPELKSIEEIKIALAPLGLTVSNSLGFNNTYALAVKEAFAEKNNLHTMSDLVRLETSLRAAFSYEFMDRKDGYAGMIQRYQLKFSAANVNRMEHALVYKAIDQGAVDVIEVYSTDANIKKFKLRVLRDDQNYFPVYDAVWVARSDFVNASPVAWKALRSLEGKITEEKMLAMNAAADIDHENFANIASDFLGYQRSDRQGMGRQILQRTREHFWLVGVSLIFSLFFGLPLGIAATRSRPTGQVILLLSALIQTIPALALLCFLIPLFGVGLVPALVALCLYSLLPVVLNTFTGIKNVDRKHVENAKAFGLTETQILTRVTLPLASPMILAGLKTATIVSIGTATLAALIGAGGYGALIVSGLSLNDIPTILAGAIPAAVMALIAHFLFDGISRIVIPKGLSKSTKRPR